MQHARKRAGSQKGPASDAAPLAAAPRAVPRERDVRAPSGATSGVPVIGIGGSAGALEAFMAFFEAMPTDSGAAFVVVQHLAPAHESLLPEILAQHTRMKVVQVQDGVPAEPNCVYVIPPNHDLGICEGVLYLTAPVVTGGIRMPIDFFFRSLADDRQERAVCILFSGAGSDGTLGVRAIRGAGGLTIAQDPQTAQYGDMPRSAIATELVDYVLPPDRMPDALAEYLRQPYIRGGEPSAVLDAEGNPGGLAEILAIVRNQTGCDFRCYKKNTILRRIERRMGLRLISDAAQYNALLERDAGEVGQLLKDLLINVTAFFRDPEAFDELQRAVIAPLVASKQADEPLRVWVTPCASGEEAYSVAMLLLEQLAATRANCPLQVFATDIDEEALQFARLGLYPESIAADVGPERLSRFFIRKGQFYQVVESLRNRVVFAAHNLIADPPFSKMDLISCRNLLIYLDADAQAKLVPLFSFALTPGGYLFLGKSEGVGGQDDLFGVVSKTARLYRRLTPTRPVVLDSPILPGGRKTLPVAGAAAKASSGNYADAIRQVLLGHFAASVVLVNARGQILQFHGQTGRYLDMPVGEPNLNLLEIAKGGLSLRLRSALHTAYDEAKSVVLDSVPLRDAAQPGAPEPTERESFPPPAFVRVTITPLARRGDTEALAAVIFEEVRRPLAAGGDQPQAGGQDATVRQLEGELLATQQDLQSNIEELQAANEELRISAEEVVSSNEELQSSNEELETSKEELQSINEELTTVNNQLQEKIQQLDTSCGDMANLLTSTQIATLFLDRQLRIKFFTPATTQVLKLIPSDAGRPISDLSVNLVDYDLTADVRTVAQGGPVLERDVWHADGSCYVVRAMPYRTQQDRVDGVVVTFDNVTARKRSEEALRASEERYRVLVDMAPTAVIVEQDGRFVFANPAALRLYGATSPDQLLGRSVYELIHPEDRERVRGAGTVSYAGQAAPLSDVRILRLDGLALWTDGTSAPVDFGGRPAVQVVIRDIAARKATEAEIQRQMKALQAANDELARFNRAMVDRELRMIELKQEVNELCVLARVPARYALEFAAKSS